MKRPSKRFRGKLKWKISQRELKSHWSDMVYIEKMKEWRKIVEEANRHTNFRRFERNGVLQHHIVTDATESEE